MKTTFYIKGETMSNNISLNDVKNGAFLAKQSYETFESPKKDEDKKPNITNPATNSSFEVYNQAGNDSTGFSATVFRNIPQRGWGMTGNSRIPKARQI